MVDRGVDSFSSCNLSKYNKSWTQRAKIDLGVYIACSGESKSMASRNIDSDSDSDMEKVTLSDLVTFDNIQDFYKPGEQIVVLYSIGENYSPRSHDWVGIFHSNWENSSQYWTYQWAPKFPSHSENPEKRSVLFPAWYLPSVSSETDSYQFLYVAHDQEVIGVSRKFLIRNTNLTDDFPVVHLDRLLERLTPPTCFSGQPQSNTNRHQDIVTSYELTRSKSEDNQVFVPPHTDSTSLISEFERIEPMRIVSLDDLDLPQELTNENTERSLVPYRPIIPIYSQDNTKKLEKEELLTPIKTTRLIEQAKQRSNAHFSVKSALFFDNMIDENHVHQMFQEVIHELLHVERPFEDRSSQVTEIPLSTPSFTQGAVVPYTSHTPPRGCAGNKCYKCQKARFQVMAARTRFRHIKKSLKRTRKALHEKEDILFMKESLLEELANQIKNLISENCNLAAVNERLFKRLGPDAQTHQHESGRKGFVVRIQELELRSKNLLRVIRHRGEQLRTQQKDCQALKEQNLELGRHLVDEKQHSCKAEQHIDNIMYTLSLEGFKELINKAGTVIDLRGREGNEVDLHGWSVAKSSQMERLTRRVAAYWRTIQDLQDSTDQLNNNLKMVTAKNKDTLKEVEVCSMRCSVLEGENARLKELLAEAQEKEGSMSHFIISERRQGHELVVQHRRQESELQDRIITLQNALAAAQLIRKQGKKNEKKCQTSAVPKKTQATQSVTSHQVHTEAPSGVWVSQPGGATVCLTPSAQSASKPSFKEESLYNWLCGARLFPRSTDDSSTSASSSEDRAAFTTTSDPQTPKTPNSERTCQGAIDSWLDDCDEPCSKRTKTASKAKKPRKFYCKVFDKETGKWVREYVPKRSSSAKSPKTPVAAESFEAKLKLAMATQATTNMAKMAVLNNMAACGKVEPATDDAPSSCAPSPAIAEKGNQKEVMPKTCPYCNVAFPPKLELKHFHKHMDIHRA